MKYLQTFEYYNYDNDELIVEKLNLKPLFNKLKNNKNSKKVVNIIAGSLLTVLTISQAINFINNRKDLNNEDKDKIINAINKSSSNINMNNIANFGDYELDIPDDNIDDNIKVPYKDADAAKGLYDPIDLKISKNAIEEIKRHERLRLTAYSIGDGMITIGYGHAEKIGRSKYKIGDKITKNQALKLLEQDIHEAENGVKRIFKQWKKQGINIKITQGQFDAMVSMAFNMGVNGLRMSEFIQHVKNNDMETAAEIIPDTGIKRGFSGLKKRRESEQEMFLA